MGKKKNVYQKMELVAYGNHLKEEKGKEERGGEHADEGELA